jgi:hypothetical protein
MPIALVILGCSWVGESEAIQKVINSCMLVQKG